MGFDDAGFWWYSIATMKGGPDMKKVIVCLLVFAMAMTFAACSITEEPVATHETTEATTVATTEATTEVTTEATTEAPAEAVFATIEAKNCFYDAGFVELIDGASESAVYTFTAENSEAVEWWVYVVDEAFDEGFRYIKQIAEPALVGDGAISVEAGQYVYVYCSANEFTTGVADENAKLKITAK